MDSLKIYNPQICILIFIVLFSCCAHTPANYNVQSKRIYDKNYDEVWASVISIFAEKNIPIKTIEKDSGIIVTENMNIPSSEFSAFNYVSKYCDCGSPGFLFIFKQFTGSYNVFARKTSNDKTSVQLNTSFRASKFSGNNFIEWTNCATTGDLERGFFRDLNFKLNVSKY